MRAVVVGCSPWALAAAALLARAGLEVRYLGWGARAAGVATGAPFGEGALAGDGVDRALLEDAWGPTTPVRLTRERRRRPRVIDDLPGTGRALGALRRLTGWAERRVLLAPAHGHAAVRAWQREAILEAGGEVLEDVRIEALELDDGRVAAVLTDLGREHVEGPLLLDASPGQVAGWLPDPPAEARSLRLRHRAQVTLLADVKRLPWLTALPHGPVFRLTRPGQLPGEGALRGHLTAHLRLEHDHPWWSSSDQELVTAVRAAVTPWARPLPGEAVVQRLAEAAPTAERDEAALASWQGACEALGVLPVGPRATGRPCSLLQVLRQVRDDLDARRR